MKKHIVHTEDRAIVTALIAAVIIWALILALISIVPKSGDVDERTKELCREYAARDHEKELTPERYKYLGKEFVDSFDWYTSCINHTRYPVGGKP